MEAEFPPLRSLNDLLHNLPLQLTSCVGREEEIREIKRLLCPKQSGGSSTPFGIELAAAKINLLSIRQIAARLDKNFHDLKGGSVTTDKRHRTLTALIDWSYNLLQPPEQTLLRRLSVFAGGWTLEAAEAICVETDEEFDVLEALSRLEQSSLLLVEEQAESNRFRLLETIRQYAADKHLATEAAEDVRTRHLAYFVRLAEQAESYLTRKEQGEWKRTLDADHDNFRAALSSSEDPQQRLRLAGALWRFWSMQGYISEGLHWLKDALSDCRDGSSQIRAGALNGLGVLAVQQNDHTTAQTALEESLALYIGLEA